MKFNIITGITVLVLIAVFITMLISTPAPVEVEKVIVHSHKALMRVALIGQFTSMQDRYLGAKLEKPIMVANSDGEMFYVSGYAEDFEGILHEGDKVFVTIITNQDSLGHSHMKDVIIDYLITEEDYRNAE